MINKIKYSSLKFIIYFLVGASLHACNTVVNKEVVSQDTYLKDICVDLVEVWPNNKTINLVFHGHSVPTGFFETPQVNTLKAYPFKVLVGLKKKFPNAVINIITTSKGGENSEEGAKRFSNEVLNHHPDVLFIDYALNDMGIGLEKANAAWQEMVSKALRENIKVILLTPTPDQNINILEPDNELEKHQKQIIRIAKENGVGLIDSYNVFKKKVVNGDSLAAYMSYINHPNENGHELVADEILKYFNCNQAGLTP
ncbi:SGNH/GDSL hydrolase family protein [Putridiphycobacter roseus]|uniref:SGNH/GDSL hydrolase family protein n=1 Tax=Putridiphycobacter roseus TaxID=2219161 RepID=A0A2W1N0V3_9FLAO|nr:GDSL-type esterase/lipase family protein [Putridiphycobacter roseus]PZE17394.1 SGNH/GDSL hydrolase family protein [Putridiphycobacter roseus]